MKITRLLSIFFLITTACQSDVKFDLPEEQQKFSSEIAYNNKVDIIWLIDNSSSMEQYQTTLKDQVDGVVNKMNELKLDYNMVVITTDIRTNGNGGQFVGSPKVIKKSTPQLVENLKNKIVQGQSGSSYEQGLESLKRVLSKSYLEKEGQGFLRDEALLVINVLGNEDDQSLGSVSDYAAMLNQLKGAQHDSVTGGWVLNFIGVLEDSYLCRTFSDASRPGFRYIELADKSGGIKESICTTNLTDAVSHIQVKVISVLTDFKLSKKPRLDSIKVLINGVNIPQDAVNGWSYIESANVIRFNGSSVPSSDAIISVDFVPAEAG